MRNVSLLKKNFVISYLEGGQDIEYWYEWVTSKVRIESISGKKKKPHKIVSYKNHSLDQIELFYDASIIDLVFTDRVFEPN